MVEVVAVPYVCITLLMYLIQYKDLRYCDTDATGVDF